MYVVVIASLPQFPFSWKNITGTWGRNCWGGVGGVGEKVVVGITNDCTPQYRNFYTRSKPLYIILSALSKLSFLWVDVFCGDSVRHCWVKLDLKTFFCCAVELCFFFTYTTKLPPPKPQNPTQGMLMPQFMSLLIGIVHLSDSGQSFAYSWFIAFLDCRRVSLL